MPNRSQVVLGSPMWRRWWASGAVRSTSPLPDHDKFMAMAARAELAGERELAGMWRVEAQNDRRGFKKTHKPNIGPYTAQNSKHCLHCGATDWQTGEVCTPKQWTDWQEMSDAQLREVAHQIARRSKSQEEVSRRLSQELGYPYGAAVTYHGDMFRG